MKHCDKCDKPANPTFTCDRDINNGEYCAACFNQMPCLKKHPEDCATTIYATEEQP